jgi:hypothetical protein
MTRQEAINLIDKHKNALVNPVEMLHWTWLRVIIKYVPEEAWESALKRAEEALSR